MLTITDLSAGYGKLQILHAVNLTVEAGQFAAILGPNGSGKSTLLKSIFGLTDHFGGTIHMAQQRLNGLPTERISRRGIAYVPQRANIFTTMTVRENLLLALRGRLRHEIGPLLERAYDLFPILTERDQQRAGRLSGGQRQMVAIAIGWLTQPKIMLLDEPSAGLAPIVVTEVFRTLQQLSQQGMTLVVVEQNARSLLRWCDYAYVLREGQLAFQGTAAALLADEEMAKGYLGIGPTALDAPPQDHGS
ncbi:MAG: ABC transporter ATP-binding protein [Caldilineaceae bacterium]